jgi:hypothetical protein
MIGRQRWPPDLIPDPAKHLTMEEIDRGVVHGYPADIGTTVPAAPQGPQQNVAAVAAGGNEGDPGAEADLSGNMMNLSLPLTLLEQAVAAIVATGQPHVSGGTQGLPAVGIEWDDLEMPQGTVEETVIQHLWCYLQKQANLMPTTCNVGPHCKAEFARLFEWFTTRNVAVSPAEM